MLRDESSQTGELLKLEYVDQVGEFRQAWRLRLEE